MKQAIRISLVLMMLLSFAPFSQVAAQEACNSSGIPAVSTDREDYGPFETVTISGSGFGCAATLSVLVTAPDGNTLSGDGTGSPGPDTVTSDANGEFALSYQLYGTLPDGSPYAGQEGQYTIQVMDAAGTVLASAAFSDSLGYDHSCAVTAEGGAKCWGYNGFFKLGVMLPFPQYYTSVPHDVYELSSGVAHISGGYQHTCALTTIGGVKCWGNNYQGQLGTGYTSPGGPNPVDVFGLTSGVLQISVGAGHTCALLESGAVMCWGNNWNGELGNGTYDPSSTPVTVSGLSSGVIQISSGDIHTCALLDSGAVKCWGDNGNGQLGNGTYDPSSTPENVSGLSNGVIQISAGHSHTCAVMDSGYVKCWGTNFFGGLGNGTDIDSSTPVDVVIFSPESGQNVPFSGVIQVSAGNLFTCAAMNNGGVKCWGANWWGQLGDGTNISRYTPVDVSGLTGGITQVSAGNYHTCALTSGGGVKCWGTNSWGQLGDSSYNDSNLPVEVYGLTSGVARLPDGNPINSFPPSVLNFAFDDPLGDNTGTVDVTRMVVVFDNTSGMYEIKLTSTEANPFFGQFRVNINLYNPDTAPENSLFQDAVNDYSLATATTELTLTGTNTNLQAWDAGDRVATNTYAGMGNPPGSSFFASAVSDLPIVSPWPQDYIAIGLAGGTTITRLGTWLPSANPGGPYLGAVYAPIQFDGTTSSDPDGDPLTYAWDFGDGSSGEGVMPNHIYTVTGVYDVCLVVNDGMADSAASCTLAVIYDLNGGSVTGGGWIESPAGACAYDPLLTGKASFGFVSAYKKGATIPTGQTEFQFQAGVLNFHSDSYQWLVINQGGTNAQFKGEGTIWGYPAPNGELYKFMIWATDDDPGQDTFRIKIWYEEGGEVVLYDNGFNQPIDGGSIQIHAP